MGTKPNWNPSPISSFIPNSLLCSNFSFPLSPLHVLVTYHRSSGDENTSMAKEHDIDLYPVFCDLNLKRH